MTRDQIIEAGVVIVHPDYNRDWVDAITKPDGRADSSAPLIRGEVGSIDGRISFVTPAIGALKDAK